MKYCSVPGCKSKSGQNGAKLLFFNLPSDTAENQLLIRRRTEWLKAINAINVPEEALKNVKICSKHFVSVVGRPVYNEAHIDWVPNLRLNMVVTNDESIENIIINLPEITEEFDVPEYVTLDKPFFDEKEIESNLICKYLTYPICDENGFYTNDHDYLGLPIMCRKTEKTDPSSCFSDHNYSMNESPACVYTNYGHFCNICQCNFSNLFRFNAHMMLHTINNDVTCPICKQNFLTTSCLNNHISLHTTVCDICGKEVPFVQIKAHQEINRQQRKAFETQSKNYKLTNKDKVHFCIFCMKQYTKKCDFLRHICEGNQF